MKIILFISIFIPFLLVSCNQNGDLPKDILSKEEMVNLLYDVQCIEAAVTIEQSKGLDPEKLSTEQYSILFKKYKLTKQLFDKNITYYAKQPELMQEIYTQVIERLSKKESEQQLQNDSTAKSGTNRI